MGQIQTARRDESKQRLIWDVNLTPVHGDLFFDETEIALAKIRLKNAVNNFKQSFNGAPRNIVFIAPVATASRVINGAPTRYEHASNKEWPLNHWNSLIRSREYDLFVVTGPSEYRNLIPIGSHFLETSFREACAILSLCDVFVGIEGGLHHAAAALHKPGVVFFGHWNSPEITGYGVHFNLQSKGANFHGCGSLNKCPECEKWLLDLDPTFVSALIDMSTPK